MIAIVAGSIDPADGKTVAKPCCLDMQFRYL